VKSTDETLAGKRILIVDDEPDILEILEEELDMCVLDKASDFETASAQLKTNAYDCAVLDIMGVRGYDLLLIAKERGIPAVMLTAHALSAEDFIKSMQAGADCYVPKEQMIDIGFCVAGAVMNKKEPLPPPKKRPWFKRFKPIFDRRFGPNWQKDS
jgi:DNA-binding NtrC family response regulator